MMIYKWYTYGLYTDDWNIINNFSSKNHQKKKNCRGGKNMRTKKMKWNKNERIIMDG